MGKQWVDIEGSIEVDVDADTFNVEFLKWVESKGWAFAGVIKPTEDKNAYPAGKSYDFWNSEEDSIYDKNDK
jgi:hypothetical protein